MAWLFMVVAIVGFAPRSLAANDATKLPLAAKARITEMLRRGCPAAKLCTISSTSFKSAWVADRSEIPEFP
jgi:hypothetical protein